MESTPPKDGHQRLKLRKASPDDGVGSNKRAKTDASRSPKMTGSAKEKPGLMSLCDELLLEVFAHCDSATLDALSGTCVRLRCIVADRNLLWSLFDLSAKPLMATQLLQRYRFLHPDTHTFRARGYADILPASHSTNNTTISRYMLNLLQEKCPHLRKLELFSAVLHDIKNKLAFPNTLEVLTLVRVKLGRIRLSSRVLFTDSNKRHLHTVRLEHCSWFNASDMAQLGSIEKLRHLSLRGCPKMELAFRYGFTPKSFTCLETFDLRYTSAGRGLFDNSYGLPESLRELYLRSPRRLKSMRISDQQICRLGVYIYPPPEQNTQLKRLILRDYSGITDRTLHHLALYAPRLRMLDLRGTEVTRDGVMAFRALRPFCELLAGDSGVKDPEDSEDPNDWGEITDCDDPMGKLFS